MFSFLKKRFHIKTEVSPNDVETIKEELKKDFANSFSITIDGMPIDHIEYKKPIIKDLKYFDNSLPIKLTFETNIGMLAPNGKDIIHNPQYDDALADNLSSLYIQFFTDLQQQAIKNGLTGVFNINEYADHSFSVYFSSDITNCYVGKINLYLSEPQYAVLKENASRASKIFSSIDKANLYIKKHPKDKYTIQIRRGENKHFMQYSTPAGRLWKILNDTSIEEYISYIKHWIKYIKYCLNNYDYQ